MNTPPMSDNPRVNKVLDEIVGRVTAVLAPRSVIIAGAFGRREGSFIDNGSGLRFLSDCEITIVPGKRLKKVEIQRLAARLSAEKGIEVGINASPVLKLLSVVPPSRVLLTSIWRPSIQHYDLKHGAIVVAGKNILEHVPDVAPGRIPLWEGIRQLFNRMAEVMDRCHLRECPRGEQLYWINKLALACQDAALLYKGQYHASYRARNARLEELLGAELSGLDRDMPDFRTLARAATAQKLDAAAMPQDVSPGHLLGRVTPVCDRMMRLLLEQDAGIVFGGWGEFPGVYARSRRVRNSYYVSPFLPNRLLDMVNGARRTIFGRAHPSTRAGATGKHMVYAAIAALFFARPESQGITQYLVAARQSLAPLGGLAARCETTADELLYLRRAAVSLWKEIC